ncbi:MAG: aminopeptidase N [Actinomycetales bacterium]|nr:aminopeptidase N [Actinomycetales bacterium]
MAGDENLTRAEAQERAALIATTSYEVDLDLSGTGDTFLTRTTASFTCRQPGASTWIDLIAPAVRSVQLNGRDLDVAEVVDGARIMLPGLAESNTVVIEADGHYMNTGEGLHRFVDPVDGETYLHTQFESADARRVYACFEQPDLKATFQLTVTAPAHWKVVSNAATPVASPAGDGLARWEFEPSARMSTYITALAAGPYHEVRSAYEGPHGTYPLGVFCRASLAEYLDADDILLLTRQGFEFFEAQFEVPYPFGKYDQLFVPEFNAGAMENAGCVTFREDMVFRSRVTDAAYEQRANTILHEMAHMWFGDLVTMTWWDDLWLNESFAEWASHYANVRATRYREAWTTFSNQRKAWAYRQDQLPSTHPIAADMVDLDSVRVNFDGITYAKGASALRQLVAWVGEEEFLAGLRQYFTKHAWGNTQLTDLLAELEATSGRDLSTWTEQWLQTSGVNLLRPVIEVAADGTYARVAVQQEPPSAPPGLPATLRSHRIGIGIYDIDDAGLSLRERIEVDITGPLTEIGELAGVRAGDMLLLNDGDLTFAKVRLDDASWRTAITRIGDLNDSLARAIIWGAAWDMTRDAEVSTGDYLSLVLSGIERETEIAVLQMVLRQLRSAIDQFAAPANRDGYEQRLAAAMLDRARAAAPGSDRQLAFARAFALSASTPEHLDVVAGLLTGQVAWEGLVIDTDLRWFLLQRLAANGRADQEQIDAELARDDTATGRRQAATALAARPSLAAKQQAWADIVDRTDLPNAILEATMAGFLQPGQRDLLAQFRDRYFADLPRVWAERTMEMAQDITVGLYPFLLADEQTIQLTDAYLAGDRQAAERRLVTEGRDGVERSIRAQARDA